MPSVQRFGALLLTRSALDAAGMLPTGRLEEGRRGQHNLVLMRRMLEHRIGDSMIAVFLQRFGRALDVACVLILA